jgi:hypothetical protein
MRDTIQEKVMRFVVIAMLVIGYLFFAAVSCDNGPTDRHPLRILMGK